MKRSLFVAIAVILLNGITWAAEINVDAIDSTMEILNATTIRIHNVDVLSTDIPAGSYWADFQWDPVNNVLVPVSYGEELPAANGCLSFPPPPPGGELRLVWNAGTQSREDCLDHGQTKYYKFTVPAGFTTLQMGVANIAQVSNLDMVLVQSATPLTPAAMDYYLAAVQDWYATDPANRYGVPYFTNFPPPAWAMISQNFSGEAIFLQQGSQNATARAASIAGTYYVAVKNTGAGVPQAVTYYIYATP